MFCVIGTQLSFVHVMRLKAYLLYIFPKNPQAVMLSIACNLGPGEGGKLLCTEVLMFPPRHL